MGEVTMEEAVIMMASLVEDSWVNASKRNILSIIQCARGTDWYHQKLQIVIYIKQCQKYGR